MFELVHDSREDPIEIIEHFIVGETQDANTILGFEKECPLGIELWVRFVDRPVEFNRESSCRTVEVGDEAANRVLSAKAPSEPVASP